MDTAWPADIIHSSGNKSVGARTLIGSCIFLE